MENKLEEAMDEKSAMDVVSAIHIYQRKHPYEDDLTVVIMSEINVSGEEVKTFTTIGTKNDWCSMLQYIKEKQETFISVEILSEYDMIIDKVRENIKRNKKMVEVI